MIESAAALWVVIFHLANRPTGGPGVAVCNALSIGGQREILKLLLQFFVKFAPCQTIVE
jgi:hypothetical protein